MNLSSLEDFKACISPFDDGRHKTGSYYLAIDKIIDNNGKEFTKFNLEPQGIVYVIFKEIINLPENVIGFAHVKTSFTQNGILSTNIGIIDPGYNGLISTLLINFGKINFSLNQNDKGLRITLCKLEMNTLLSQKASGITPKESDDYLRKRISEMNRLDQKFLNLSSLKSDLEKEVKSSIFGHIRNYAGFVTITALILALVVFGVTIITDFNSRARKEYISKETFESLKRGFDSLKVVIENGKKEPSVILFNNPVKNDTIQRRQ